MNGNTLQTEESTQWQEVTVSGVYTHHCSAASECDQVANSFCFSLEEEGNRLSYDFILASLFKSWTSALFAKFPYDGDISQGSLHPHPYSHGVGMYTKPHYSASLFVEFEIWAE